MTAVSTHIGAVAASYELTQDRVRRFWKFVPVDRGPGCWPWSGECSLRGYGRFYYTEHSSAGAHRVSLRIATGDAGVGMLVLHSCDNPPCVNPAHLRYGSNAENMDDMWLRGGREVNGEDNPNAKLTEDAVMQIRSSANAGRTNRELAAMFGVGATAISTARSGKTWAHLLNKDPK